MTSEDIIKQAQVYSQEYLEMVENPDAMVSGILANQIIRLLHHIDFLERRLKNVSMSNRN
jgi:hypothetical protein